MKATLTRLSRFTADPLAAGDGPLLDAFLGGDQTAFAVLVRRHAGLVFATCRRVLRHQQDAEDAFQATFLVLARRAADVWPREAVGSWLFGVAHRVALKARAVRSRKTVREQPLEDVASTKAPPPDFDLVEVVHRVVCKLPEVYRAAVVACDLEGLSRKEAAERLGWSEGTLSGRLARARDLLAARLRRLGLSLPAGGLAGVFATAESVSAKTLQSTIQFATGSSGASAPVTALTEGIVRSMALFKLKTMTAVMFAACAIGISVFAAAGFGAGDGPPSQQSQTQSQGPPSPTPVAAKPADPPAKAPNEKPSAKPITDRDRLQGSWRVVSLTEGGKTTLTNPKDPWVIEFSGGIIRMPYLEGGTGSTTSSGSSGSSSSSDPAGSADTSSTTGGTSGFGWKQKEYSFTVDENQMPRTIDLIANQKPVGHGIYEFTAPAATCATCHKDPFRFKPPIPDAIGLCGPGLKTANLGVRVALSIDGKRPTKFGGDGVIVFELKRLTDVDTEREKLTEYRRLVSERLKAALTANEKAKYEAELRAIQQQLDALIARDAELKARAGLREAQANLERARAVADVAQVEVALATTNLAHAKERLAVAEKALADLQKARPAASAKEDAVFTVHVRTLTAAEKVIRVKATGKETVLDGLAYTNTDVLTKPSNFTVWVLRDGTVMPVDLSTLTKNADSKTDYPLKPGDQLFVQTKPGK